MQKLKRVKVDEEISEIIEEIKIAQNSDDYSKIYSELCDYKFKWIRDCEIISSLFGFFQKNERFIVASDNFIRLLHNTKISDPVNFSTFDNDDKDIISLALQIQYILISNNLELILQDEPMIKDMRRSFILFSQSVVAGRIPMDYYFSRLEELFSAQKGLNFKNFILIQIQLVTVRKTFQYWRLLNDSISKIEKWAQGLHNILESLYKTYDHFSRAINNRLFGYGKKVPHDKTIELYYNLLENRNFIFFERIIKEICSGFVNSYWESDSVISLFWEQIYEKITRSSDLVISISKIAEESLAAFLESRDSKKGEWGNKIYISTFSMLWIFRWIKSAKNKNYIVSTGHWALKKWIKEVHEIINKNYLSHLLDDWLKISHLLTQENQLCEWKEAFILPNSKIDPSIPETILCLINTEWWHILIWKPDEKNISVNAKIKSLQRKDYLLLDSVWQLTAMKKDLDNMKRNIQDWITSDTGCNIYEYDRYWRIEEIKIYNDDYSDYVELFLITVNKASTPIYSKKDWWITLRKRANARNECVSPEKQNW